jgi:hypothetical protein
VTRGNLSGLAVNDFGSCLGHTGATLTSSDAQLPAPGNLFTYLVHGQSYTCGVGSLGFGANETQRTNFDAQACAPAVVVERTAVSETLIAGTVDGNYQSTHTKNDIGETIREVLTGGSPASRYSFLEHRFVVDVAPGTVIELVLFGERSASTDGDDLRFEWSTNGTTFTPVQVALPTFYDDKPVAGPLPATLSGPVTIRVIDSDRTAGHQFIDYMYIDQLVVRSITY